MEEYMRETEMTRIQTEADAMRQENAIMMSKLNENFYYSENMLEEEVAHKRR